MNRSFLRVCKNGMPTENCTFALGEEITLELCAPDATSARFYLGNDEKVLLETEAPLSRRENDAPVFSVTLQTTDIAPEGDGLFFFHFETETPCGRRYTVCDCTHLAFADRFTNEFQLTVYNDAYPSPDWLDGGVFYHIFVDRFCKSGRSMRRTDAEYNSDWENGVPEYPPVSGQAFPNNTHFGGDLYGVADKISYLKDLGVTVIYLSPIADAYSNHKYDTGDYLQVDPTFGGEKALRELIEKAHDAGIKVILDGVFNHVGDDSIYFNRYGKYESVGAYQSKESPYYPWFTFEQYPDVYESWWGIQNLPKPKKCKEFRSFICEQVIPKYMRLGVDGYRLDVADELESDFLDEIVASIKKEKADAVIIGEVWEDASNKIAYNTRKRYLRGKQLSGVMNYPFRNGLITYLTTGDASLLREVTETLHRHYPPKTLAHTMNSIGTHDTERILTVLGGDPDYGEQNEVLANKRMTSEQREKAVDLLICGYTLLAALPGIPCIYYGDEAGMEGYHDPFNRRPFPWHAIDSKLHGAFRAVNRLRAHEKLFSAEGFRVLESPEGTFAFQRYAAEGTLDVISNRTDRPYKWFFVKPATDLFTGETVSGEVTIPACSTKMYKDRSSI